RASLRRATVIIKEPAEARTATNVTDALDSRRGSFDQFVRQALVMPIPVVMLDVLSNRPPEVAFAERDHPVEAFLFDGAHEPVRVGIRIGRALGDENHADDARVAGRPISQKNSPISLKSGIGRPTQIEKSDRMDAISEIYRPEPRAVHVGVEQTKRA